VMPTILVRPRHQRFVSSYIEFSLYQKGKTGATWPREKYYPSREGTAR
jgi:hypothetical protein